MAYGRYGRGRRVDPYAEEQRRKAEERSARKKAQFERLLRQYRQIKVTGEEAQRAWKEPARRTLYGKDGPTEIIRGSGSHLYLQSAGAVGWNFYRLVPRYDTPRSHEVEGDQKRTRLTRSQEAYVHRKIRILRREHPKWKQKQVVAVAISYARRRGR